MQYRSTGYRVFTVFNTIALALLAILCILPMIHIMAVAFSGRAAATANLVYLWPVDFTLDAFKDTLTNENFSRSVLISVQRTVLGLAVFLVIATLTAYPLSKESHAFKGRSMYTWFFIFTMLFSGGLVPLYILVMKIGLNNSIWALILPSAVDVWSIILLLNFFRNIPKELEEASLIDGAGHIATMIRIYLPLSLPALATLSLFTLVFHWNEWFHGLLFNTDAKRYPLATLLQTIVVQQDFTKMTMNPEDMEDITNRTVKAAQIFIGALPILLVYPFLQRFFVKGIVLGAVKG